MCGASCAVIGGAVVYVLVYYQLARRAVSCLYTAKQLLHDILFVLSLYLSRLVL